MAQNKIVDNAAPNAPNDDFMREPITWPDVTTKNYEINTNFPDLYQQS
jgi:hypothetical protein